MSQEHPGQFKRTVLVTGALLTVFAFLVGFYVLPRAQTNTLEGIWQGICRAAGLVPARSPSTDVASPELSSVVVPSSMRGSGSPEQIGRGATLALRCTMCHGASGLSEANSPNLSGQYADVIYKQLIDYRRGARVDVVVMTSLAKTLSDQQVTELAHYYAYLPKPGGRVNLNDAPALVRVGDPIRNIAPCASCHGSSDRTANAPRIDGEPRSYLERQLIAFRSDARHNDVNGSMRNVAHQMTSTEIAEVSRYYAALRP
jgi:cytochrome c553